MVWNGAKKLLEKAMVSQASGEVEDAMTTAPPWRSSLGLHDVDEVSKASGDDDVIMMGAGAAFGLERADDDFRGSTSHHSIPHHEHRTTTTTVHNHHHLHDGAQWRTINHYHNLTSI